MRADYNSTERTEKPLPGQVSLAQRLFQLIAAIWLVFAVLTVLNIQAQLRVSPGLAWTLAIMMFANAGLLFWVGRGLARRSQRYYLLALSVLAANILLTITDDFGIYDAITLAIDIVLFVWLLITRSSYTES